MLASISAAPELFNNVCSQRAQSVSPGHTGQWACVFLHIQYVCVLYTLTCWADYQCFCHLGHISICCNVPLYLLL